MDASQHDELVNTFSAVTGADVETANHVLEAHAWDLNNSVEFFLEQSANNCPLPLPAHQQAHPFANGVEDDEVAGILVDRSLQPTRIEDSDEPVLPRPYVPHHPISQNQNGAKVDDIQRAIAASREDAGVGPDDDREWEPDPTEAVDSDEDVEDLINRARATEGPQTRRSTRRSTQASTSSRAASFLDDEVEEIPVQPRQRRSRPRGAAAAMDQDIADLQELGRRIGVPDLPPIPLPGFGPRLPRSMRTHMPDMNARAEGEPELPAGINIEEARMLEAAMLGIPYEGGMPSVNEPWQPQLPPNPAVMAQRQLREEQDAAYQASLLADMEKAKIAQRAQREAEEAEERRTAEAAAAEEDARQAERLISSKRAGLPAEPSPEDPQAMSVLIRLPNGGRLSRRFVRGGKVETLFDWVDVNVGPDIKAGMYRLVAPFPRRQLQPGSTASLEEAGLTQKQEALFLEPL